MNFSQSSQSVGRSRPNQPVLLDTDRLSIISNDKFWIILALALALRAAWAFLIPMDRVSDEQAYHLLASQLAAGGTYGFDGTPNAFWPVGYPFFLSLHYRWFGPESWLIPAVSVLLGTLVVGLTMVLAHQWFSDKRVALLAGLVIAVYPAHIQFSSIISSELLFTCLLLCGVIAWSRRGASVWGRALITGCFLGLAAYVRPVALAVPAALVLAGLVSRSSWRTVVLEALVMGLVMGVTVAPWTYRNYCTYGRLVPISTNGGMCLFFGNNPLAPNEYQAIVKPKHFVGTDADRDAYCAEQAKAFIADHPGRFLKRAVRKALRLWERDTIGVTWNRKPIESRFGLRGVSLLKIVSQVYWVVLLLLVAASLVILPKGSGWRVLGAQPGLWIALEFTVLHAIMYSQDRYHFPLVPLLAPLMGVVIVTLIGKPRISKSL